MAGTSPFYDAFRSLRFSADITDQKSHLSFCETAVNAAVVCIAVWQAIRARNIKSEFSESKYIGLSVFSMGQAFLTGIPIVAVVRDIPQGE